MTYQVNLRYYIFLLPTKVLIIYETCNTLPQKNVIWCGLLRIKLVFAMVEDGIGYAQNRILCHFWSHKAHIAHIGTQPVCACFCVFVCFALRFRKQPSPDYPTVLLTLPEYTTIWLTSAPTTLPLGQTPALWKALFYSGTPQLSTYSTPPSP